MKRIISVCYMIGCILSAANAGSESLPVLTPPAAGQQRADVQFCSNGVWISQYAPYVEDPFLVEARTMIRGMSFAGSASLSTNNTRSFVNCRWDHKVLPRGELETDAYRGRNRTTYRFHYRSDGRAFMVERVMPHYSDQRCYYLLNYNDNSRMVAKTTFATNPPYVEIGQRAAHGETLDNYAVFTPAGRVLLYEHYDAKGVVEYRVIQPPEKGEKPSLACQFRRNMLTDLSDTNISDEAMAKILFTIAQSSNKRYEVDDAGFYRYSDVISDSINALACLGSPAATRILESMASDSMPNGGLMQSLTRQYYKSLPDKLIVETAVPEKYTELAFQKRLAACKAHLFAKRPDYNGFVKSLRGLHSDLPSLKISTEPGKGIFNKFRMNASGNGFDALRFRSPSGPRMNMVLFMFHNDTWALNSWYILPLSGQMQGFLNSIDGCTRNAPGPKAHDYFKTNLLNGEILPDSSYILWFSFSDANAVDFYLAVSLFPDTAEMKHWALQLDESIGVDRFPESDRDLRR